MKLNRAVNDTKRWLIIVLLVYTLVCAVSLVGGGFKVATADKAKELFYLATHPFVALFIGTLTTALIQSSSTVTSIIVGLVAGGLPISAAIPMIMGANIGTTITNTIVSFGHVKNRDEFKRAFAAATIHDVFNLLAVLILFPLEITTHFLQNASAKVATLFVGVDNLSIKDYNYLKQITKPVVKQIKLLVQNVPHPTDGVVLVGIGIVLVFISIYCMGIVLKKLMKGRAKKIIDQTVGRNDLTSFLTGLGVTVAVQSSSTSTSIAIPFAGNGFVTLKQLYPYTMGANVGTTVTALLAATAVIENQQAALTVAIVHLFFNISACVLIYFIKPLKAIPYRTALFLAEVTTRRKYIAVIYTLSIFFFIPAIILVISS